MPTGNKGMINQLSNMNIQMQSASKSVQINTFQNSTFNTGSRGTRFVCSNNGQDRMFTTGPPSRQLEKNQLVDKNKYKSTVRTEKMV